MIKATSQQRRKPGTGQQQGDIRGSTLTPAATAANSSARNACQGTYPPSRRPQSVLRGPSRGEEATKKLLAIRSVPKGKLPSPSRYPACGCRCGARAASARGHPRSPTSLTFPTGLTSSSSIQALLSVAASRHACAKAIRMQRSLVLSAGALQQSLLPRARARAITAQLLTRAQLHRHFAPKLPASLLLAAASS